MIVLAAQLAAAVALLMWSTRLIRTGVERAFMPELKSGLKRLSGNSVSAAAGGSFAAMIMQSATAVALISAGFAVSGMLAPHTALALVLGAELGSALMTRVLILPVDAVLPFALLIGVTAFFKAHSRKTKQVGRIIIGLALVFISLGMIREATAPIGDNAIIQSIASYFRDDLVSAYVLGAVLTWAMHSSLAAVLTFATFAATGLITAPVAAALVIGANLGGAAIPFALLWTAERPARLIALGNLVARGSMTLGLPDRSDQRVGRSGHAGRWCSTAGGGTAHLAERNAASGRTPACYTAITRLANATLPRHSMPESTSLSALDPDALDHPPLALACAQRELLRMSETVQAILLSVMHLFRDWDPEQARMIERREDEIDRMHFETKIYVSRLRETNIKPEQDKKTWKSWRWPTALKKPLTVLR